MTAFSERFGLPPLGFGVGLRSVHYQHILAERPPVGWFEVLSDNYMHTRGRPLVFLDKVAALYPVALHGVGLSIGSSDALDRAYLKELAALRQRVNAHWVSDHICWTGVHGRYGHDLYPVPFTEEALRHIARRVCQVQDFLEAPLVLENPSTYLEFTSSVLSEPEFISALLEESDAGLLLDVNNVYVNAHNHGFDPRAYLQKLPLERVVQFHVAGHTLVGETGTPFRASRRIKEVPSPSLPPELVSTRPSPTGDAAPPGPRKGAGTNLGHEVLAQGYLADTHSAKVADGVWQLLEEAVRLGARAPVLIEWDADIPSFPELQSELEKAQAHVARALAAGSAAATSAQPQGAQAEIAVEGLRP